MRLYLDEMDIEYSYCDKALHIKKKQIIVMLQGDYNLFVHVD